MKVCSICKIEKPLDNFSFQNKALNKRVSACKTCSNKRQRQFRKDNPELQKERDRKSYLSQQERRIAYAKEYRMKYPDRTRKTNLKTKYGITEQQYINMKEKQNSRCDICGEHQDNLKRILCVDHCHTTGKVRGLLCDRCNKLLGFYEKYHNECETYIKKHT